jgi:hypothetical protein
VIGKGDYHLIPAFQQARRTRGLAVNNDRAGGDQPSGLGAGELKLIGEEAVEPFGRLAEDRERE